MVSLLARGTWIWRVAAVGWMALLFWLSSRSDVPDPFELPSWLGVDKLVHFGIFAVLGALVYLAGLRAALAVAVAAIYGVTDEIHQMYVPGRSPDVRDWVADALGATGGVWVAWLAGRRSRREPEALQ